MLSKEIATSLRGKALTYLMLPLSFKEYLEVQKIHLEKDFQYKDQSIEVKKHFLNYLKYGGFPEIVLSDSLELKNRLINSYFDSVLYKDLVDRLKLKNLKLVDITLKYILNSFGNTFSISSFEDYLKSNKIGYSLEDLYSIFRGIQDVFMACFVKQYFKSFKKSEFSKSKIYLFDTSYAHFLTNESEDYGRILENIVFIDLFRRAGNIDNNNLFYYKSKDDEECDFVISDKDKIKKVIQVTYLFNYKTREREIRGLVKAMDFFNLKEGLILTYEQEEEFKLNGKKIIVKPVWKWLLEKEK
jgi:predicted AAA+ superfamily ATPase